MLAAMALAGSMLMTTAHAGMGMGSSSKGPERDYQPRGGYGPRGGSGPRAG